MNTIIYWFSGTGNSLEAAKMLEKAMGNTTLEPMANNHSVPETIGGAGCRIGFVFPSYYGNLPRVVRRFLEQVNILPETDLFAVVTMGAFGAGAVRCLEEYFAENALTLRYGVGLKMPANYLLKYDPAWLGAKNEKSLKTKLNKCEQKIQDIATDIVEGKEKIKKSVITSKALYTNIAKLDEYFIVTPSCTSCGVCEKVCPVENIKLAEGKPVWQHHCEHCVACISWCPAKAIEYGTSTQKRMRYKNPRITADMLIKENKKSL